MNDPRKQPSSSDRSLTPDEALADEESRGAWTEPMTIRPFGETYLVNCHDGGTHVVTLGESNCSCGGASENDPCRHVRRVAIEINLGRLPPPSADTVSCAGCETEIAVGVGTEPPFLCRECSVGPGDVVVDEQGDPETPLLVVSEPWGSADDVTVQSGESTVAEYRGNEDYPSSAPVVEVIFPHAVSLSRPPKHYVFPVSRLSRPDYDEQSRLFPPRQ